MATITLRSGKTLRLKPGTQHIWDETHYRASAKQVRGITPSDIPRGVTLWIGTAGKMDCPHCEGSTARTVLRGEL